MIRTAILSIPRRLNHQGRWMCLAFALLGGCGHAPRSVPARETVYEAFAVRFATVANFPLRNLVAGADSSRRLDIAMMVWPLRAPSGGIVLIDAGFHREKFLKQWEARDSVAPTQVL